MATTVIVHGKVSDRIPKHDLRAKVKASLFSSATHYYFAANVGIDTFYIFQAMADSRNQQ